MNIERIKNALSGSQSLNNVLLKTRNIAIIEYNGNNIDGSNAFAAYLSENDVTVEIVSNVVLLGKKSRDISKNARALKNTFPCAEITIPGKDLRSVDKKSLNIDSTFVLHMVMGTDILWEIAQLIKSLKRDIEKIVAYTRRAYFAILYKSIPCSGAEPDVLIRTQVSLADFVFTEDPEKVSPTTYCIEKREYLNMFLENTSAKDIFFQIADEVGTGCNVCNQCSNYGHRKQCPLAQRHVAKCYREGIYVPQDEAIAHQWEVMASRQGYKPARLQVADDLRNGTGCKQNIDEALSIYSDYAHLLGNEDCAEKIIEIVRNNDTYSELAAIPHIARKANAGDGDKIFWLAEAFREGSSGLPCDIEQQKLWIERGAESGEPRFILAKAKMYEENGIWDSAIAWYEKLNDLDILEDYTDKINELEGRLLQFDLLPPEEIAKKGFDFLLGYGVEENFHLAILCFVEASKHENALGERGLAVCYKNGYGVEANAETSLTWQEKAAEHGSLRAMADLYEKYQNGEYFDFGQSDEILEKFKRTLTEQLRDSYVYALRIAGDCYSNGTMSFDIDPTLAVTYYQKAIEKGDIPSMVFLGDCYHNGSGVPKDYNLAFKWYSAAADKGMAYALCLTGCCYYMGQGVPINYIRAFEYFKKAANRNINAAEAKYYLGECYILGRGTDRNENQGYSLVEESANGGCGKAMAKLCEDYYNGRHYKKDYEQCRIWGEKALSEGNLSVRFQVAYSSSKTGHTDRARELYTALADEGNIAAMNNLGCLESTESLKVEWFTKAADGGDAVARCNIGRYYRDGTYVEQNYETAREYFEKSAAQGYHEAMYELALFYKYGYGVDADISTMLSWYSKAIEKGNKKAMTDLAECYKNGDAVEQDYDTALKYYLMAAELDNADDNGTDFNQAKALYCIGAFHENGFGVAKNVAKAIFWYRKAANKNYSAAKEALNRLETNWLDESGHTTNEAGHNENFPF